MTNGGFNNGYNESVHNTLTCTMRMDYTYAADDASGNYKLPRDMSKFRATQF